MIGYHQRGLYRIKRLDGYKAKNLVLNKLLDYYPKIVHHYQLMTDLGLKFHQVAGIITDLSDLPIYEDEQTVFVKDGKPIPCKIGYGVCQWWVEKVGIDYIRGLYHE